MSLPAEVEARPRWRPNGRTEHIDASGINAPVGSDEWWLELGIRQQARFWAKVQRRGAAKCWLWLAGLSEDGSGKHSIQGPRGFRPKQKHVRAPKFAWEMAHGLVPAGLIVYHQCENIRCVRPAHLALGTMAEMRARCGATAPGEKNNNARHCEETVRLVKLLGESGRFTDMEIARRTGVPYRQVWAIRRGRAWRHVVANLNVYRPNLAALYAEQKPGRCVACDEPCVRAVHEDDPDCWRVYSSAAHADQAERAKLRRELAPAQEAA